jgi:hypothetical protein
MTLRRMKTALCIYIGHTNVETNGRDFLDSVPPAIAFLSFAKLYCKSIRVVLDQIVCLELSCAMRF